MEHAFSVEFGSTTAIRIRKVKKSREAGQAGESLAFSPDHVMELSFPLTAMSKSMITRAVQEHF